MRIIFFLILSTLTFNSLFCQEVEFQITINTPKLQTTDPKVFEDLRGNLENFLNNQKWTDHEYEQDEKIKCNIQLTIREEVSATSFRADLNIQSTRPVYGSNYETALLTHVDKDVDFTYEQFQPLEYSKNVFNDNLSSILSFYIYIILGLDYDSFAPLGGEDYFQSAQDILTTVPPNVTDQVKGWRSLDGNRNRYWIIENILTPRVRTMREAIYEYHRMGLDFMHDEPEKGRTSIMRALEEIERVGRSYPNSMIIQMFFNAKRKELVEIFKGGSRTEKTRAVQIMSKLDAANAIEYRKIIRS